MTIISKIQQRTLRHNGLTSSILCSLIVGTPIWLIPGKSQTIQPVIHRLEGVTTASIVVSASPSKAWEILTRYEGTALKMPDIKKVKLISRKGKIIKLQQIYQAPYTFGLKITALLEIEEKGRSMINYKMLEGNFIRNLEGNWILIPVKEGTLVAHRIAIQPALPGILKPLFFKRFDSNLRTSMLIIRQQILQAP